MGEIRNRTDIFATKFSEFVLAWRWPVIIVSVLVTLLIASGAQHLTFASNYRVFFSAANPELTEFEAFQATYTKNDNFMIVLEPADGDVFTGETLAVIEELTEAAWRIPYASRVDSITNF